jgi:hypothetical protein
MINTCCINLIYNMAVKDEPRRELARGVTDPGVGSGAWFGRFNSSVAIPLLSAQVEAVSDRPDKTASCRSDLNRTLCLVHQ